MKKSKNWFFVILLSLSFSIVHEFAFVTFDNSDCSVNEYVSELDYPSDHGDICDAHFEYHQAYILPVTDTFISYTSDKELLRNKHLSYIFAYRFELLKPPIV